MRDFQITIELVGVKWTGSQHINEVRVITTSVVMGTNFSVGFRWSGYNQNLNQTKFIKPKLPVVINTSFLAVFPEFNILWQTVATCMHCPNSQAAQHESGML